jgi:uncharacterized protein YcgI (DUF1989 family)
MERFETVPAGHGRAVTLAAGQILEVINSHGTQVVDTWAFAPEDPAEFMSMAHTRSVNSRLWPRTGEAFVSLRRRPMLRLLADTSPGVHDTLLCACNAAIYAELGCTSYHRSCEDNLHEALAAAGVRVAFTPAPLNLFMNVRVAPDGALIRGSPASRPGERVVFRAERDLLVVLSACPQDITPINSEQRTPRDVRVRVGDRPAAAAAGSTGR